jgi:hypothetical protein
MSKINADLLKSRVKEPVHFSFFRDGALWYTCADGWTFPIPVRDTDNAQGASPTFNAEEKGILLMKWIRKAMEQEAEVEALTQETEVS